MVLVDRDHGRLDAQPTALRLDREISLELLRHGNVYPYRI
jgi:hypothetical protein